MSTSPMTIVSHGWRKVCPSTLLYVVCTHFVIALPPVVTLPGLMMRTSKNGMTVTASSSDTIRLMVIVQGKSTRQSWKTPFIVHRKGKKMAQMQMVASIIGMKYCRAEATAASFGS